MATLFHVLQFFDNAGNVLSFGRVYWYQAGTFTNKTTWKDQAETTTHTNPIDLDIAGRPPGGSIFIRGSYELVVKDSTDSITYLTIDNINEYNQYDFTGLIATIGDLNSTHTVGLNINAEYTAILAHRGYTILCDATSAAFNVNLLPSATALNTYKIIIKKVDVSNNAVTIIPSGSEKIDTDIDFILYDFNDFVELHCDGSNWKVVASQVRGTVVTQTTAKTLTLEDNKKMFNCDTSAGSFNLTLPDCRVVGRGYTVIFKKTDSSANETSLITTASQHIDNAASYFLHSYNQTVSLKTNGLNWFIVSESRGSSDAITGDVKTSFNNAQPGWVVMQNGSIGNASSGATARANADTQDLFILLWNRVPNAYAPVPAGRGASALADFNANKTLVLTPATGRVLCNIGSAGGLPQFTLGQYLGDYVHWQEEAEVGRHRHPYDILAVDDSTPINNVGIKAGHPHQTYFYDTHFSKSQSKAFSLLQPILCLEFYIKL